MFSIEEISKEGKINSRPSKKAGRPTIAGIRNVQPEGRLAALGSIAILDLESVSRLTGEGVLPLNVDNDMIENVVGKFELPMGW